MFDWDETVDSVRGWLGTPDTSDGATAEAGSDAIAAQPDSLWGQIGQTIGDVGRGLSQEGIGGLLDPSGMMDRQQAQRDLSSRFQVVDDDFVGPRNHNQVSQEEYEEIARTYSNVRMGRGDLTVDSSSFAEDADADESEWRQGTMNALADMMMTTSGRRQVMSLSDNALEDDSGNLRLDADGNEIHHSTTITPYWTSDSATNDASNLADDNAYAGPDSAESDRRADGSRGMGANSTIEWNPAGVDGLRGDIILAHEMQHARGQTQGTQATGTYDVASGGRGQDATYVDEDGNVGTPNSERDTVGLTRTDSPTGGHYPGDPDGCTENDYRSERNQLGLGERWLPRTAYGAWPLQAGSDEELRNAWDAHEAQQAAERARLASP